MQSSSDNAASVAIFGKAMFILKRLVSLMGKGGTGSIPVEATIFLNIGWWSLISLFNKLKKGVGNEKMTFIV